MKTALIAIAATLLTPSAADAQAGVFGRLRDAARDVRGKVLQVGQEDSGSPSDASREAGGSMPAGCDAPEEGEALPEPGPRPAAFPEVLWPGKCPVSNLDNFDFSRGRKLSEAYHAASQVPCSDCTGTTVTHDSMVYGSLTDNQFGLQMGEWAMDKDVVRRGRRYVNVIHPIGEFALSGSRCKVFQWSLKAEERTLAQKYSLVCFFKGPTQRSAQWNALVL